MDNILIDLHTHSSFSPDAKDSADEMCRRAYELGLSAYALTDHCDCNYWYPVEHYFEDISKASDPIMYGAGEYANKSISEQVRLKNKYDGKLNIIVGIELGQPLQDPNNAEKIVSNDDIDFIIGSHHQNEGEEDFYFFYYNDFSGDEIYRLLNDYFTQMLEMCKWGKFDVLGHLTYPLRYICGDYGIDTDLTRYDEIIREIFITLITKGKGIEINTSGLRQKYGKTFPSLEYVKLYKNLGGEIVTIGSDSHCTADLGKGIAEGIELVKSAGFSHITYFKKHEPKFLKI